jgi:hypothetical protein
MQMPHEPKVNELTVGDLVSQVGGGRSAARSDQRNVAIQDGEARSQQRP